MKRALSRLRLAGLALPLLLGGCMAGVLPGADAPDPSCVLLCALTREATPAPASQPSPVAAAAAPSRPVVRRIAARAHRHLVKAPEVATAPPPRNRVTTLAHPRPMRHKPVAQVSVVPQAPPQPLAPQPVAMAPVPPVSVGGASTTPVPPARSLSAAIPGSAGIMMPAWHDQ